MDDRETDGLGRLTNSPASTAGEQPAPTPEPATGGVDAAGASARDQGSSFEGEFATPSEIVPTSEGVTRYGGADDWSDRHLGVHTRLDGWREHRSLPAVRRLITKLRKSEELAQTRADAPRPPD